MAERITHISEAIDHIRQFVENHSSASFESDLGTRLAVERLLEVISEASRHIPQEMKAAEAAINWRRLADLGNWLRHAYHQTDAGLLWDMIENDLEPLKDFVRRQPGKQ